MSSVSKKDLLHQQALQVARSYRKAEADLILILQKIEEEKVFSYFGCTSLFDYAVSKLFLSENVAYTLITVSRKTREIPALQECMKNGEIEITKIRRISPVINEKNQNEWIEKAKNLSTRDLEREIALSNPSRAIREKARYICKDRIELKIGVTEKFMKDFIRMQNLLSQKNRKKVSYEECLVHILEYSLQKVDPEKRHQRRTEKNIVHTGNNQPRIRSKNIPIKQNLPIHIRDSIWHRDKSQCTFIKQDGLRCSNKYWLDIHHILPKSMGGEDAIDNLTLLCRHHHSHEHKFL